MENQRNKSHEECQSELRYLFKRLTSWKEESQIKFSNIINSQSTIIENGISNLVEEVSDLQAQLSVITKERNNLLETVENMGGEIKSLQAKLPSLDILPKSEENHSQDADKIDNRRTQAQDVEERSKLINDDDYDLDSHIDDAESNTKCEEITDEVEGPDQQKEEKKTVQLTNAPLHKKNMETHMELVKTMEKIKVKCKHCPYISRDKSHLKDHIEAVHERGSVKHCVECGFKPSRNRDMKYHMQRKHGKTIRHVCEDCGHEESQKSLMTVHKLYVHELKTKNLTITK